MQPANHHIAEFNRGVLRYDWDDPRVADFANGVERVNAVAERSDGFVWRVSDEEMEAAQLDPSGPLGGNPRVASTLSVWRDVSSLEAFVWDTVHRVFYQRKTEWFEPGQGLRLVMWWVPVGHRPSVAEAVERFDFLCENGPSEFAFGWKELSQARLWQSCNCERAAA